jgi:hypothetical protein
MVARAESWATRPAAHCGKAEPDVCLETELWRKSWSVTSWRTFLNAGETESNLAALRKCTHTGRPLGSAEFVKALEQDLRRKLAPRKGGRRSNSVNDRNQESLGFED